MLNGCEPHRTQYSFSLYVYEFVVCEPLLFLLFPTYFFLFATVLTGPLRVRALFLVFCPRTGSPRRWRIPLLDAIAIKRLTLSLDRKSVVKVNSETNESS